MMHGFTEDCSQSQVCEEYLQGLSLMQMLVPFWPILKHIKTLLCPAAARVALLCTSQCEILSLIATETCYGVVLDPIEMNMLEKISMTCRLTG